MKKDDKINGLTKTRFTELVEAVVHQKKITYLDSIIVVCENLGIDPDDVKKFISPVIMGKAEAEAMNLNLIPREEKLPF